MRVIVLSDTIFYRGRVGTIAFADIAKNSVGEAESSLTTSCNSEATSVLVTPSDMLWIMATRL